MYRRLKSLLWVFSCLHRASVVSKTLFIIPTDAHYYKIIEMLITIYRFKIITLAPTCLDSRRNHHQEAVLCFAKTTNMVFLCSSVLTQSMLWRHISLLCISWTNKKCLLWVPSGCHLLS